MVERKEKNAKKWSRINKDLVKDTNFFDEKVSTGKEYEYRVLAVNEEGEGNPSSEFVTIAKPEKGKLENWNQSEYR